ncbi:hypothetical protein Glove_232g157 [Diversispora epigaea]|uniref:AAA+ ATPase domain-containing protein n=1 Tax=Diversispora epigaea TaxID=1348612 RepID=A0A397IJG0_9GLOM|nr:hypothetical protein Glove_232g157 [Diversispora epigaea]
MFSSKIRLFRYPHQFLQRQNLVSRNLDRASFQSSLYRSYTNPVPNDSEKWKSAWNKKWIPTWNEKWIPVQAYLCSVDWKNIFLLLINGGAIFFSGDLLYLWWVSSSNKRHINETMEKGTRPISSVTENMYVSRPEITKRLTEIYKADNSHSSYHLICGERGTGKTTITKKAANEVGQGVIYIDFPANFEKFGDAFGKALNFTFGEDASFVMKLKNRMFGIKIDEQQSYSKWMRAMDAFIQAAKVYKEKHGKPPVIIYDNVDQLIPEKTKFLDILQDEAKFNADESTCITIFMTSEGAVPRRMELRSSWSRAKTPVIEIGDLSEKESKDYLINKYNIKEDDAKKLYEMVGGRIVKLKDVAEDYTTGKSFEDIKKKILNEVFRNFERANVNPGQKNHEAAKIIIKNLLNSNNVLHVGMLRELTNVEPGDLLENNVFAYHPQNMTYNIKEDDAKKLYEMVGGRIVKLKDVAEDYTTGKSFEDIKKKILNEVFRNFERANVNPGQKNHEAAKIIIKNLLNSNNVLHVGMLRELTNVEPGDLLENNVFAYHPQNMTTTATANTTQQDSRDFIEQCLIIIVGNLLDEDDFDAQKSIDFKILNLNLLNGFYTGAIYDLSEAIIIDPNNCYALKCRAYCYYKLKLYEEALCDLKMIILLECGCESTYINKANIMKELKKLNNST